MIRKITRGTSTVSSTRVISCEITNPDKVIVILNQHFTIMSTAQNTAIAGSGLYLISVSANSITIAGGGAGRSDQYTLTDKGEVSFSYQIIEFM